MLRKAVTSSSKQALMRRIQSLLGNLTDGNSVDKICLQ